MSYGGGTGTNCPWTKDRTANAASAAASSYDAGAGSNYLWFKDGRDDTVAAAAAAAAAAALSYMMDGPKTEDLVWWLLLQAIAARMEKRQRRKRDGCVLLRAMPIVVAAAVWVAYLFALNLDLFRDYQTSKNSPHQASTIPHPISHPLPQLYRCEF